MFFRSDLRHNAPILNETSKNYTMCKRLDYLQCAAFMILSVFYVYPIVCTKSFFLTTTCYLFQKLKCNISLHYHKKDRVSCKITKIACQAIHQVLLQGVRKIKSNSFYLPYFLFSVPFIYCFLFFSFYLVQMLALLLCRFFGRNYFRRNKNLFIFLSKTITIHKLQNPLH